MLRLCRDIGSHLFVGDDFPEVKMGTIECLHCGLTVNEEDWKQVRESFHTKSFFFELLLHRLSPSY
jgi:hypothetical protein